MINDRVIRKAINSFKYVLGAQGLVFLLGILKAIILPKYWSVEAFGYWQLYLFYTAYVGLFALGFNDGIYLRYGKFQYKELPFDQLRTAIRIYLGMLLFFCVAVCCLTCLEQNPDRAFVFLCVGVSIISIGLNGVFIYILQITNQMKKYSFFAVADKLLLLIGIFGILLLDDRNYKVVIGIDLTAKFLMVCLMIYNCRKLWQGPNCPWQLAWQEFRENISVGIKLMIANLMGMLVLGISRIMVEWFGNIEEYAYYSFGIAATNLIFIFITAVSMVMYPTLKRLPEEHYGSYFIQLNQGLDIFNFTILVSYFPACWFISIFLPHYTPVLSYLNLLFAVIVLQSKISLLNNTFYKALREEKAMLQANMGSVLFFSLLGMILFIWTRTIWSIALSMFITMLLRCYLSEFYLRKRMKVCRGKHWIVEIVLLSCFLLSTGYISNLYLSGILYGIGLLCYYLSNLPSGFVLLKKLRYHA